MRSKVLNCAVGLGLAWSGGQATAQPATGELFPPAYQVGPAPTSGTPPTAAPGAPGPTRLSSPAPGPVAAAVPRPRMAPAMNARAGRERLASFPRSAPVAAAASTPRPTVAAMLSGGPAASGGVPDYVPPGSRGTLARLVRRGEADVPPGLARGATRREMVPPEPLVADRGPASAVDPLLAPRVASAEPSRSESVRPESARGELTARHAVDPLLAPRGLPPARDPSSSLLAQVPPRSEDPLLARKPLAMDRRSTADEMATPAPAPPSALTGLDPFSPILPRTGLDAPDSPNDRAVAPAARAPEPPRLIARPGPPGNDEPLRRVGATPDDF